MSDSARLVVCFGREAREYVVSDSVPGNIDDQMAKSILREVNHAGALTVLDGTELLGMDEIPGSWIDDAKVERLLNGSVVLIRPPVPFG